MSACTVSMVDDYTSIHCQRTNVYGMTNSNTIYIGACRENSTTYNTFTYEDMLLTNTLLLSQLCKHMLISCSASAIARKLKCTNHNSTFSSMKHIDISNDNQDASFVDTKLSEPTVLHVSALPTEE